MLTNCGRKRNTNRKWAFHQAARPGSRMHCLSSSHKSIPECLWLCMKDACAGCLSAWPLNFTSNLPLISSCYQTWQTGLFSALVDGTSCFKTEQTTKRSVLRGIREMKMLYNLPTAMLELKPAWAEELGRGHAPAQLYANHSECHGQRPGLRPSNHHLRLVYTELSFRRP